MKTYTDAVEDLNRTASRIYQREEAEEKRRSNSARRSQGKNEKIFTGIGRQIIQKSEPSTRFNSGRKLLSKRNTENLSGSNLTYVSKPDASIKTRKASAAPTHSSIKVTSL